MPSFSKGQKVSSTVGVTPVDGAFDAAIGEAVHAYFLPLPHQVVSEVTVGLPLTETSRVM